MLSNHVMNKGLQSLDIEDQDNSAKKLSKTALITEELLYLRILNNHKSLMFCILLFHIAIMAMTVLNMFNNMVVMEEGFICKHAYSIKNIAYACMNFVLIVFAFESLKRNRAMIANIQFYEKTALMLILGMLSSFLIVLFKFIPDFICANASLSLFNCSIMTSHILFENLVLLMYIKWFRNELRSFGALIN